MNWSLMGTDAMPEPPNGWKSRDGNGALWRFQESVPVGLIATPRAAFRTCTPGQRLADVVERNRSELFDHLPVISAEGSLIGVLEAVEWFDRPVAPGRVKRHMRELTEELMIGADASILDFIREADRHPFRLVVKGARISGLVCLSDLQQIAVRAALFALVTHLEMAMATAIKHRTAESEWMQRLDSQRRAAVRRKIAQGRQANTLVDPLVYTTLSDKIRILAPEFAGSESQSSKFQQDFEAIRLLRNSLAHATDYASTRGEAKAVCSCVRRIDRWIGVFEGVTEETE